MTSLVGLLGNAWPGASLLPSARTQQDESDERDPPDPHVAATLKEGKGRSAGIARWALMQPGVDTLRQHLHVRWDQHVAGVAPRNVLWRSTLRHQLEPIEAIVSLTGRDASFRQRQDDSISVPPGDIAAPCGPVGFAHRIAWSSLRSPRNSRGAARFAAQRKLRAHERRTLAAVELLDFVGVHSRPARDEERQLKNRLVRRPDRKAAIRYATPIRERRRRNEQAEKGDALAGSFD